MFPLYAHQQFYYEIKRIFYMESFFKIKIRLHLFLTFTVKDCPKGSCISPSSMSSLKKTTKPVSNANSIHSVVFTNKGITCQANSILRILSVIPNRVFSLESNILSPILCDINLNMALKKNSTRLVNPSSFLSALNANYLT